MAAGRTRSQRDTAHDVRNRRIKIIVGSLVVTLWVGITLMFLGLADPPGPTSTDTVPGGEFTLQLGHLFLFGVLGLLVSTGVLVVRNSRGLLVPVASGLFVGVMVAVFTEWFQLSVSGRSGNVEDILTDVAGVVGGAGLTWVFMAWRTCLSCAPRAVPVPSSKVRCLRGII